MVISADVVAGTAVVLIATAIALGAGTILWRRSRTLAVIVALTSFAALLPVVGVAVLIITFQVFGVDLID